MTRTTLDTLVGKLFAMALVKTNRRDHDQLIARAAGYDLFTIRYDDETTLVGCERREDVTKFDRWYRSVENESLFEVSRLIRGRFLHPSYRFRQVAGEVVDEERMDECMAFIGDVLGKNLQIAVDARGMNSFGHLVLKDDRLWYVHYKPDVLDIVKGEAEFRRFAGIFDSIPTHGMGGATIDMSFHVKYNLSGDIRGE